MPREFLIGLDAGGGAGRCLVVDLHTGAVTSARRRWTHSPVRGSGGLGDELALDHIWSLLGDATREALARANASPDQVLGVAAASVRHSMVLLDAAGEVLFSASNRDARAIAEGFGLAAQHGPELHERTGHWPLPSFAAARLMWLSRVHPETWARAASWLSLSDWLTYRLCGSRFSERSQAGESLLLDVKTGVWAEDLVERFGARADLLPTLAGSGQNVGVLGDEAAGTLGLRAGTPVAIGGADTQCGLLGVGAVVPGMIAAIAGTTAPVQLVLDQPMVDPEHRLWTGQHLLPDHWVIESNGGVLGEALDEVATMLFPHAAQPAARLLALAAESEPGANGILSTLGADVMNARDLTLPVSNLTFTLPADPHGPEARSHLARGIAEGMAYGIRANVAQVQAMTGRVPSGLRLAGGLSRSGTWAQIVADVLNDEVHVSGVPEASALGAAICAGVGSGVFENLIEGSHALCRTKRVHRPDPERATTYARLFSTWGELRAARSEADRLARSFAIQHLVSRAATPDPEPVQPARPRILVTAHMTEAGRAALRALGEVQFASYREHRRMLSGPALVEALQGFEVLITEVDIVDLAAIEQLPELRLIASCRADAVNVDVEACTAFGIPVLHAPGRNAGAVADLTLAFLLMLARRIPEATAFLHQPEIEAGDMARMGQAFSTLRGRELWHKTVGLIGLGAAGSAVARRLEGFGARVLAFDPAIGPEVAIRSGAEPVDLATLLRESDFVSLHATVTDESRGLLGPRELANMKPGACLINTARAALVDETALADALRRGALGGAALDTFSVEPPGADHPLLGLPNVIATPHVAGNTEDVASHQGSIIAASLAELLAGERPAHVRNPSVLAHFDWTSPRFVPDAARLARIAERPGPAVSELQRDAAPLRRSGPTARRPEVPDALLEKMKAVLRGFVDRVVCDEQVAAFSRDKDVTLHFVAGDLGLELWIRLYEGQCSGDLGPPEAGADVVLRMSGDVLDGMFTGRVNAMDMAMSGRLSFTGDAAKALTLQYLQDRFDAAYRDARLEVGDPGDLSRLANAPRRSPAPSDVGSDELRESLVESVDELFAQKLITATGGNVSARIGEREELWITPSQMFKGSLRPELLVRLDLAGRMLDLDARSPSSESLMHCRLYQARPDVRAVVHAHAPHATILANTGLPFLPISTEAAVFADIPRIPFAMPGTVELADAVAEALGDGWAVLMQNHGLLVAARSLRRAAEMVEIIERSAEVLLGCHAVGKTPPTLPDDVVAMLRKTGDLVA